MKSKLPFIVLLFSFFSFSQILITANKENIVENKMAFDFGGKRETYHLEGKKDGLTNQLVDVSKSVESFSSSKITISNFPVNKPFFAFDSNSEGWTDLNVATTIIVHDAENVNLFNVEGTTQVDNNSVAASYQFAIGIFVDNQLKMVKEFEENAKSGTCNSAKFDLSGVFENLSVGEHTIKVYAYNLPKTTSGYSSITYGGSVLDSCKVDDKEDGKIHLTVQYSE